MHFLEEFENILKYFIIIIINYQYYYRIIILKILSNIKNNSKDNNIYCNNTYFYDILRIIYPKSKKIDLLHLFSLPDPGG